MALNQLTIDKDIHLFVFDVTIGVCLLVATASELGLAARLLPVPGSRTLLLLSSLFSSSSRGITLS